AIEELRAVPGQRMNGPGHPAGGGDDDVRRSRPPPDDRIARHLGRLGRRSLCDAGDQAERGPDYTQDDEGSHPCLPVAPRILRCSKGVVETKLRLVPILTAFESSPRTMLLARLPRMKCP